MTNSLTLASILLRTQSTRPSCRLRGVSECISTCPLRDSYQWSRPAPSITKPNPNVIIRLCDIECNFAAPLTDPSNAPFQKDMNAWAAISNRTYIWCAVAYRSCYFPSSNKQMGHSGHSSLCSFPGTM
jgi:hypothetical protein